MRIARQGIFYVLVPAALAGVAFLFGLWPATLLLGILAAFMAFFFRDPERYPPSDTDVVVAPADGRVTRVKPVGAGSSDRSATIVSIFLSPLDVHINRAPIAGAITDVAYTLNKV